jgi:hypothetical protein
MISFNAIESRMRRVGASLSPRWREHPLRRLRQHEDRLWRVPFAHPLHPQITAAIAACHTSRREIVAILFSQQTWLLENKTIKYWTVRMLRNEEEEKS